MAIRRADMRRTKQAAAESRDAIVDMASRLFRERGFEGVGVADIMAAAGMTHGGFYRHFASKEALIVEAMETAFETKARDLEAEAHAQCIEKMRNYITHYLSAGHAKRVGDGCPIAALGSEAPHAGAAVTEVFAKGVERLIGALSAAVDEPSPDDRRSAMRLLSTLVGAIIVARATGSPDLQDEVLSAVRADPLIARMIAAPERR